MLTSPSRWAGSSPSATTRAQIRPTVSQSMRTSRVIVVLSVLVAKNATRSSKSQVNRAPARANGTPSVSTPWVGQQSRRSSARTITCQRPRSSPRHDEATGRVSRRARVE